PLFLFLPPLRPPRPTLFPYTTLFRSLLPLRPPRSGRVRRRIGPARNPRHSLPPFSPLRPAASSGPPPPLPRFRTARYPGFGQVTDRKSTRLNSSHVKISYAVFCLKKK